MFGWLRWGQKAEGDRKANHISVIIPALNEEQRIEATINSIFPEGTQQPPSLEVIVVDGGSSDLTVKKAKRLGVKVLEGPRGRAKQMNAGAKIASGDLLLFLHADSLLPLGFHSLMSDAIQRASRERQESKWGCFQSIRFDAPGLSYRIIEEGAKIRTSVCGMPYGDQGIFVSKDEFDCVKGYSDMPLLEDADLVARLRKRSPMAIVRTPLVTSARRYQTLGHWQTTLLNSFIIVAWRLGAPVPMLARIYHNTGIRRVLRGSTQPSSPKQA